MTKVGTLFDFFACLRGGLWDAGMYRRGNEGTLVAVGVSCTFRREGGYDEVEESASEVDIDIDIGDCGGGDGHVADFSDRNGAGASLSGGDGRVGDSDELG